MNERPLTRTVLIGVAATIGGIVLQPSPLLAQDAPALTLDDAVRTALARSPAVQQAEAEYLAGRALRTERYGRMLPSLTFSTGLDHLQILTRTAADPITGGIVQLPDSLIDRRQRYGTEAVLSASWTIFDGGRRWSDAAAGRHRARAAGHAADAARTRVSAEVTLAFIDALEAEAVVEVRRAELERARELERTAAGRFQVGEVPEIDLLQARLVASEADIALLEAESNVRLAHIALLEQMGVPADRSYELVPPDAWEAPLSDAEIRARVLERSPAIAELQARAEAAEREARGIGRNLLPSVTVGGTWVRSEVGLNREAFTTTPNNTASFYSLRLSWSPLQQPGSLIAERDRARATRLAAEADLAAGTRALDRELEAGLERLARARSLQERAELNAELAERQREHAAERYRLGLATILERVTADALWADAMRQRVVARYAALRAVAEIERVAGVRLRDLGG